MTLSIGQEFRNSAVGSEEWWRRQRYLADTDNTAVLTPGTRDRLSGVGSGRKTATADGAVEIMQMIERQRLQQEQIRQINHELDDMDEQAVDVLQNIEHALTELRLQRERLLEQAYKDEDGRAIVITADGTGAYYIETREPVDDETFDQIRGDLIGGPTFEDFLDIQRQKDELEALRDDVHAAMAERDQLRDDLESGKITADEAEERLEDIRATADAVADEADALFSARDGVATADSLATDRAADDVKPLATAPVPR